MKTCKSSDIYCFHVARPWLSWIEYLTTNQGVTGSNPVGRATLKNLLWLGMVLGMTLFLKACSKVFIAFNDLIIEAKDHPHYHINRV